jgi:hypothetical protein
MNSNLNFRELSSAKESRGHNERGWPQKQRSSAHSDDACRACRKSGRRDSDGCQRAAGDASPRCRPNHRACVARRRRFPCNCLGNPAPVPRSQGSLWPSMSNSVCRLAHKLGGYVRICFARLLTSQLNISVGSREAKQCKYQRSLSAGRPAQASVRGATTGLS